MKFIKAIKKTNPSRKLKKESLKDETSGSSRMSRLVPGLLADEGLRIGGAATATETEQSSEHRFDGGTFDVPEANGSKLDPHVLQAGTTATIDVDRVNRHLVAITDPKSAFAEEYRDLRTTLLHKSKKQRLRTIAIVSVAPEEGKSVTALNLAWLLAQTEGVRALLIDGDMRRPSICKYLGLDDRPGLSELLDGEIALKDALVKLEPSGLNLLPGGRARSDVAEQISGPNFAGMLDEIQRSFDFVIMDAPPLGVFVDAKVLIDQADGALLVLRRDFTNYKEIDRILEGLPRQRMLGVVLNQAEETLISGRYYYDQY